MSYGHRTPEELMIERWSVIRRKSRSKKYIYEEEVPLCPRDDGSCCGDPDLCIQPVRTLKSDPDHVEYWKDDWDGLYYKGEWGYDDEQRNST